MKLQMTKKLGLGFAVLLMAVFTSTPGYSQCIAGLPCVVNLEPNDPYTPGDGPNFGANASKNTSNACDADFMNQIYARAFIEAERETILGEVIMRKPDSVLEYTCYDQIVSMTAHIAGPLFSETLDWVGRVVNINTGIVILNVTLGPTSLDSVLEDLVLDSLDTYVNDQFGHDFLGGAASGQDSNISNSVGSSSYNCSFMNDIFQLAKCNDFATDDQFFSFQTLTSLDPRLLPSSCASGPNITTGYIDVANNVNHQYAYFDDVTNNYLALMRIDPTGTPIDCHNPPIPTGVRALYEKKSANLSGQVTTTTSQEYDEMVCPNPACHYVPPFMTGGGTCRR